MPVPQLVKMKNFFGQNLYGGCFQKPLQSLYTFHHLTIEIKVQKDFLIQLPSIFSFIETWHENTKKVPAQRVKTVSEQI